MNALAKEEVGKYLNQYFVSSFQRVGSFRINGNNKQGGNVASYFCTPQGRVLHVIAGKVNDREFLREARWVMETRKLADLEGGGDFRQLQVAFRSAHVERLRKDFRVDPGKLILPQFEMESNKDRTPIDESIFDGPGGKRRRHHRRLNNQGKVHKLLATYPLVRINRVYRLVFEEILNEDISTRPVVTRR